MGHYPCPDCCAGHCVIHADTFDRGDTTTIPNTTELVGDWENTSNQLHPDHAASDQRLKFDLATPPVDPTTDTVGLKQTITIQGQAGDRIGLGLIFDTDGDTFTEATVRFGTGTSGRINMNHYVDGALDWTHNEDNECAANQYDIDVDTPIEIELCTIARYNDLTLIRATQIKVTVGSDVYRVGYAHDVTLAAIDGMWGAAITGTDAITAFFDDYTAYQVGPEVVPTGLTCEFCPHCEYDAMGGEYRFESPDNWVEQISGTWTGGSGTVETDDANAIILWAAERAWANDNMGWLAYLSPFTWDGNTPQDVRFIVSWVDDDNYFFVELSIDTAAMFWVADWRLVEVAGGTETEIGAGSFGIAFYLFFMIQVWDCTLGIAISDGVSGWHWYCFDALSLNNTGRWGLGTGATVTGTATFLAETFCAFEWDCDNLPTPTDPTPPEDPGPPLGCCDDLDGIVLGGEYTIDFTDLNVDAACSGDACFADLINAVIDLNATDFTVECVFTSGTHIILFGDTGIVNPCGPADPDEENVSLHIWVWIDREGDDCILRVGLTYTTFFDDSACGIFFELTLAVDESCQNRTALFSSGGGCCIDASAASATLTLF